MEMNEQLRLGTPSLCPHQERGGVSQVLFLKDFHQLSQDLLLWLASAESRRQKAHVTSPEADRQVLLECQKELMVSFLHRPTNH